MKTLKNLALSLGIVSLLAIAPTTYAQATATTKAKTEKKVAPSSPIDINTATQDQLVSVPGIGAPTAKKIIAGRPYSSVSDLSKAGLSAKQVSELSPMLKASGGASAPVMPSKVTTPPAAAKSIPTPAATTPSVSSPSVPSASTATSRSIPAPSATAAPGGGAGMVWVNKETKVFHRQGDRWYGKTKDGMYMTEADALKAGYRESKEKVKSN